MNLDQYLILARRCVCLSIAPASLPCVLSALRSVNAELEQAYFWRKGGWGSSGLLLLQSTSSTSLSQALLKLHNYPRQSISFTQPITNTISHFNLPPYRVCSDPSIWAVACQSDSCHFKDILKVEPKTLTADALETHLLSQESIVGQMECLVSATALTHPQRLLRFTFSDSLQEVVSRFRPGTTVFPYGSAINGLGAHSSDLDLVMHLGLDVAPELAETALFYQSQELSSHPSPRAFSIMEGFLRYTGQNSYRTLSPIRLLLGRLDPISGRRTRIFPSRVAIINYTRHQCLGVGIDICHESIGGLRTAYLMRIFATQVPVFPFLAFTLKHIMRAAHITQHGPSPGITSFKLIALLIHFLQASGSAPPLEYLLEKEEQNNEVIAHRLFIPIEERMTCPEEAADLLKEFCMYLRDLKPDEITMCLRSGRILPRTDVLASNHFVHCPDPVNPQRNITHGINEPAWEKLMLIFDHIHSVLSYQSKPVGEKGRPWGLTAMHTPDKRQPTNFQLSSTQ